MRLGVVELLQQDAIVRGGKKRCDVVHVVLLRGNKLVATASEGKGFDGHKPRVLAIPRVALRSALVFPDGGGGGRKERIYAD